MARRSFGPDLRSFPAPRGAFVARAFLRAASPFEATSSDAGNRVLGAKPQRPRVSASPALRTLCDRAGTRPAPVQRSRDPQPHPCGRGSVEVCSASKRTPRETNRTRQSRGREPAVKVVNHAGCCDKSRSPVAHGSAVVWPRLAAVSGPSRGLLWRAHSCVPCRHSWRHRAARGIVP